MRRFAALALLFVDFSSVSDESQTSSLSAVTKTFCYYPKSQCTTKNTDDTFSSLFFSELIFFYSFLHKRNVKMKGETKVTQTGLKKGGKSCSFNVLLIIIFGLLFCPFCALATLIALRPFGESMYGKKV